MAKEDPLASMAETVRNLRQQSKKLRAEAKDLSKESARIRAAVNNAQKARKQKRRKK